MLPPDAPLRERILWAALSAIVGLVHDGPEVATEQRLFQRLEAASISFGIPTADFDALARRMDFHYYRPWDCYLGREAWKERTLADALPVGALTEAALSGCVQKKNPRDAGLCLHGLAAPEQQIRYQEVTRHLTLWRW